MSRVLVACFYFSSSLYLQLIVRVSWVVVPTHLLGGGGWVQRDVLQEVVREQWGYCQVAAWLYGSYNMRLCLRA